MRKYQSQLLSYLHTRTALIVDSDNCAHCYSCAALSYYYGPLVSALINTELILFRLNCPINKQPSQWMFRCVSKNSENREIHICICEYSRWHRYDDCWMSKQWLQLLHYAVTFKLRIKIMNNYTMSQTKKWKVYLYLMMFAKLVMFWC